METKDICWFIKERKAQFDCAIQITGESGFVVIDADVKCGKKEILICCSLLKNKDSKHIYSVNLTRVDTKEQVRELNAYGISTFIGKTLRANLDNIKREIEETLKSGKTIYLHVDEADYGSGSDQCFSDFLKFTSKLPIVHIFYSATAQELLCAENISFKVIDFVPDPSYRGAEYFINNNLVFKAEEPFFNYNEKGHLVLTAQGEECCKLIDVKQGKNIGVIRITTSENKHSLYQSVKTEFGAVKSSVRKSLDKIFGKNNYVVKFTDKDSSMFWGDRDKNIKSLTAWYDYPTNKPVLHIINQTSTRSTEWALQPYLAFYHAYRKNSYATTICQGDSRSFGYRECNAKIYTSDPDAFAIPAHNEEYLQKLVFNNGTKISPRVKTIGGISKSGRAKPGSYDMVLLFEGMKGLEVFEADDPIHKDNRENPSIRYNGHHYRICNRISTWGNNTVNNRSNLARFMLNQHMAYSEGHDKAFGWIDKPSILRPDWKKDFDQLCQIDPRIKTHMENGLRVFAIFVLKNRSNLVTKDNSIYSEIEQIDPFTE